MFAQVSALLAIYFVMWWIVLFATLPFGVRNAAEAGENADDAVPGADPGAPVAAMLVRKALWTTIISGVIFTVALIAYRNGFFGIDRLAKLMGVPL